MTGIHPMWLPPAATAGLAGLTVRIDGDEPLVETVRHEAARAGCVLVDAAADITIAPARRAAQVWPAPLGTESPGRDAYVFARAGVRRLIAYGDAAGALYGWFDLVRRDAAGDDRDVVEMCAPQHSLRMLDHWDNVAVHPVMGQVERGYAGGSIFFVDGEVRDDLERVGAYARLLASIGINRIAVNNVNVGPREARLLTDGLADVARIADALRPWGIRLHLAVGFSSPMLLGGLATADPLDDDTARWWATAASAVYERIPDFGGFLVKADSEGQPGPFAYGRDHADGANMLARALAPHGGLVHWRAFVYDHRQDWRDRRTDRARAAYDHFRPLDGRFDDNVILQVKHGPLDFQVREPVSPVIPAMTRTSVALELQLTQEYTGQQRHAVYLAPQWREYLDFRPSGPDRPSVADIVSGGIVGVSNVGDDEFWTGHPLAQANLYAFGRLAWTATLEPAHILDEWAALTFGADPEVAHGIHGILDDSWRTYEDHTAPLGVGFMVVPHTHYGPSVDGYEYSPWGTYHFADRDGIGVDRTVATGTGYAGQYPEPWRSIYESLETVPDELLLFFHHVSYAHRLHDGTSVIQHIYDSHFEAVERVGVLPERWAALRDRIDPDVHARVAGRLEEQVRSAVEWRDQINTYFLRKSGIDDEKGRQIY